MTGTDFIIDITQDWEVEYWTFVLDASPDELRAAITAVGPRSHAVRLHLELQRQAPEASPRTCPAGAARQLLQALRRGLRELA